MWISLVKRAHLTLMTFAACIAHIMKKKGVIPEMLLMSTIRKLQKKHPGILKKLMTDVK